MKLYADTYQSPASLNVPPETTTSKATNTHKPTAMITQLPVYIQKLDIDTDHWARLTVGVPKPC